MVSVFFDVKNQGTELLQQFVFSELLKQQIHLDFQNFQKVGSCWLSDGQQAGANQAIESGAVDSFVQLDECLEELIACVVVANCKRDADNITAREQGWEVVE